MIYTVSFWCALYHTRTAAANHRTLQNAGVEMSMENESIYLRIYINAGVLRAGKRRWILGEVGGWESRESFWLVRPEKPPLPDT